jgi:hypothetical protein
MFAAVNSKMRRSAVALQLRVVLSAVYKRSIKSGHESKPRL